MIKHTPYIAPVITLAFSNEYREQIFTALRMSKMANAGIICSIKWLRDNSTYGLTESGRIINASRAGTLTWTND